MQTLTASGVRAFTFADDTDNRAKVAALNEELDHAIEALLTSDQYKAYLNFVIGMVQRQHSYSWANMMLIWMQCPDASLIFPFSKWKEYNRSVRKGEKGIRIFAPLPRTIKETDDSGKEVKRTLAPTAFKAVTVFDVSQTDGEELPDRGFHPVPVEDSDDPLLPHYEIRLRQWLTGHGITLSNDRDLSPAGGYWDPGKSHIAISSTLNQLHAFKTLTHEAAHFHAGAKSGDRESDAYREHENIAESAAYFTLGVLGFDTSSYSFPYVAGWARDPSLFRKVSATAQTVALDLLAAIRSDPR